MKARVVRVAELSARDELAWRELADRALEPNPFYEPDFLRLNARHFDRYGDTALVIACQGDTFKALLPIVGAERPRIPPRRVATTGARPTAVRPLGTPIVDADEAEESLGAVLDALHDGAVAGRWPGVVVLDRLHADGPVAGALRRVCRDRGTPAVTKDRWERGMVRRDGAWKDPLTPSRRKQIGRTRRSLARDGGGDVTVTDGTAEPSAVADFLAMEAAGWKGREGGLAFARDPRTAAWFKEWWERWAASGRLHALTLRVAETPVAMEIFVRAGEGLFDFRSAYDERYAKHGPGAMVLYDAMQHLYEQTDAAWIDSSTDKDNRFLLEMLPERRTLCTMVIATGRVLDKAAVATLPAMASLVAGARSARARWPGAG